MNQNIPIFAHRGASAYAVENSFKAFLKAKQLGANGIELDVQCTEDEVLVVFHDLNLFRLTGVSKLITDCTEEELKKYPIGKPIIRRFSSQRIPKLLEVIEWANTNQLPLNIELKESLETNRALLKDLLYKLTLPKGSHFSSFHEELLKEVKMQRPDFETAILVTKKFDWNNLSTYSHIDSIHAHKRYYKEEYLQQCEDAKKGIRFYSIDGMEPFLFEAHSSVIGWITDYPDRLVKIQKKLQK